jgi:G3E family GTPase
MTVLGGPMLGRATATASPRRSVTLLGGFLGSGKTTLLRRELERAVDRAPAVVVNDFGSISVDGALLECSGQPTVVLAGGCACCTRLEDVARALLSLLDDEQQFAGTRRDVVIETSGLSDPGPIAFTIANDPVLKHHYALGRICVTVDALTGLRTARRHPVALRQFMAADDLIVTKADLAQPDDVEDVVRRLREINPFASVSVTAGGDLLRTDPPQNRGEVRPAEPAPSRAPHTDDIATVEFATDEPQDWEAFAVWLTLLVHRRGPDVLRVKGILDVRDIGAVAINGVQHIIHRPEHLPGAEHGDSRIVLIVRGIDAGQLERSLRTFLAI